MNLYVFVSRISLVYTPKEVYTPYKEAWYVGLGQEGVFCVRLEGTVSSQVLGALKREGFQYGTVVYARVTQSSEYV